MNLRRVAMPLAPVAFLATGACFATRNDVRILQADILTFRQAQARSDSIRGRQVDQVAAALGVVSDSLRNASARLLRFQGDTRGELRVVNENLLRLQELVGQSQVTVQRLRAEAEARALQQAAAAPVITPSVTAPVPAAGDTAAAAAARATAPATAPSAGANPGPNQLFQDGLAQYRRGSFGAAQVALEDLLRLYPASDLVPDALYYLAESYDAGGTPQRADTVFQSVVDKHPGSPRAALSLYKMGLSLARRGRRPEARVAMERLARQYPASDEAILAREWLAANR